MPASNRRRWIGLLKLALALVVCLFVVRALGKAWGDIQAKGISVTELRWSWVLLSAICYLLGMLPMGIFWHKVLLALGETPTLSRTLRAFYVSQLGKYVPGKVTVVLVRMSMLHGECRDFRLVTLSVFVETLTMMAVGAGCASLFLLFQAGWAGEGQGHLPLLALAVGLSAIAGVPTVPALLRFAVRRLSQTRMGGDAPVAALDALQGRLIAMGWLLNLPGWCLLGVSYWAALKSLPLPELQGISLTDLPRFTAGVGLSVVAGFISLLPGGAFVREWVLKALMAPAIGETAAIVSAIWLRLIWLSAEGGIAGIMAAGKVRTVPLPPHRSETPTNSLTSP